MKDRCRKKAVQLSSSTLSVVQIKFQITRFINNNKLFYNFPRREIYNESHETRNVSDFLQMISENQPLATRHGTTQYESTTTNPSVIHGINSAFFVHMAANVLHRFLKRQFRYRTNPHDFMSRHANAVVQILG